MKEREYVEIAKLQRYKDYCGLLVKNQIPFLAFEGEPGLGKSTITRQICKQFGLIEGENLVFQEGAGFTPIQFFRFAYKHRDADVVVLDDVSGLIDRDSGVALFKCFELDNIGNTELSYAGAVTKKGRSCIQSDDGEKIPPKFKVKFKIIMLTNDLMAKSERRNNCSSHMNALFKSRGKVFYYNPTVEERKEIALDFASKGFKSKFLNPEQCKKVVNDIFEYLPKEYLKDVNFRTIITAYSLYANFPDRWLTNLIEECHQYDSEKKELAKKTLKSGYIAGGRRK